MSSPLAFVRRSGYRYDPVENVFHGPMAAAIGCIPHVMWHITDVCPLSCGYCFAPKTESSLAPELITDMARKLADLGVQKVDISGGEPLSVTILPQTLLAAAGHGIYSTLTTSGVGRHDNVEWLARNMSLLSRLIVSIDAPDAPRHNQLRRSTMAWRGLNNLLDRIPAGEKARALRVNTVVTRAFFEGNWIEQMVSLIAAVRPMEWCLIQPHPANRKPTFGEYDISDEQFKAVVSDAFRLALDVKVLTRDRTLYSTYWSLQPSGVLRQHTDGVDDQNTIDLVGTELADVLTLLSTTQTRLPHGGKYENRKSEPVNSGI